MTGIDVRRGVAALIRAQACCAAGHFPAARQAGVLRSYWFAVAGPWRKYQRMRMSAGRLAIVGDEKRRLVDAIDIAILRQVVGELRAGSAGEQDQRVEDVGLIEQPFRPVVSPRMFSCAPDGRMASAEIAASAQDVVRDKCGMGGLPLNQRRAGWDDDRWEANAATFSR